MIAASTATAAKRYEQLVPLREPYLRRGRTCASVTIPSLLPPEGHNGTTPLPTPFQSMGADGALTLAGKLLFTLFPPNQPYFKLSMSEKVLAEAKQKGGEDDLRSQVDAALRQFETLCVTDLGGRGARSTLGEAALHNVVVGNGLLHVPRDGNFRFFRLDSYVVRRSHDGSVQEIIVREKAAISDLPDDVRAQLRMTEGSAPIPFGNPTQDEVDVYTWIRLEGNSYVEHQEIKGVTIAGSQGSYPKSKPAWIALRWNAIPGSHYGRGRTEEYLGDLLSLEGLSKALVEGTAAAARVLIMVNPNGSTDERDLEEADNLAVISGNREDVGVLQLDKFADFRVASDMISRLEQRISRAFLMTASIQRQAERVTAEEIRLMAQELEEALGAVYANFAHELQLSLANRQMAALTSRGELPALPAGSVAPSITTGYEALGRGQDLQKLDLLVAGVAQTFGPAAVEREMNVSDYIRRRATALGMDTEGLVKSAEQKQAEAAAAQQAAMLQQLGPNAINQLGGLAKASLEQPQ